MKKTAFLTALFAFSLFSFDLPLCAKEQNVRPAVVAGTFYPASKKELSRMVGRFLENVPEQKVPGNIVALIVPHAGYIYSGQIAAYGYKLVRGLEFDSVILIGPSHHATFRTASIWQEGSWKTPLGNVPVDSELAKAIAQKSFLFQRPLDPYAQEHSLEVQLPFLQKTVKNFKIVPILVGTSTLIDARYLSDAIVESIGGKKVLIVVSTDMSHYHSEDIAKAMDTETLGYLEKKDGKGLHGQLWRSKCELCGGGAVLTVLEVFRFQNNVKLKVLKYGTSADVTGDKSRVVGYSASVLYHEEEATPSSEGEQPALNPDQQKKLLEIARETLKTRIISGSKVPQFKMKDSALEEKRGVFVTLKKDGALRGCIGHILPQEPLYLAVRDVTVSSALEDYRFSPVTEEELESIEIEISVLSVPKKIQSPDEIELGKHGVILRKGISSGVFLPQVATETGWTKEQFLNELAFQKAGLPANAWKEPDAELLTFTAQIFSEKGYNHAAKGKAE